MAYGLYLVLDQTKWGRGDFSNYSTLTGTIYEDKQLTKPLQFYSDNVKLIFTRNNRRYGHMFEVECYRDKVGGAWVPGLFKATIKEGEFSNRLGIYNVRAVISHDGQTVEDWVKESVSTINRVEFLIVEGSA